jgi:S-adenosylmethionine synthetase
MPGSPAVRLWLIPTAATPGSAAVPLAAKIQVKVDRSGAYAARYIAKNIVAAGLATKCEVGLAYVIGHPRPLMQTIDCFDTATVSQEELHAFKDKLIDTSVKGICDTLDLRRPIYSQTSAYGHFGKADLPWEKIVKK